MKGSMGQVLFNIEGGEAKEEERPSEQNRQISPAISDSCSDHSSIQVVDNKQVSPPSPDLNTREPREEDQSKVEDNEEEELIISKEVAMNKRLIQHYSGSHSIQVIEDNRQVSPPSRDLNTREPIREKLMTSKVVMEERWIQHYSSSHKILLVGEGDFSFSAALAVAFGSATNMVATSLDSTDFLCRNYKKARSNIEKLRSRGCTVMHGVDATRMSHHCLLKGMTFDRIIFNFPLAGFFPGESRTYRIRQNQAFILVFLMNARHMISKEGEIHIVNKSWGFFRQWKLGQLAPIVGLGLIEELPFNFKDYTGYHTKYGCGGDRNFNCNPSKTYKFGHKPREIQFEGIVDEWEIVVEGFRRFVLNDQVA